MLFFSVSALAASPLATWSLTSTRAVISLASAPSAVKNSTANVAQTTANVPTHITYLKRRRFR